MIYFLVPVLVALSTILQGGLNKGISDRWSFSGALMLNAIVFLVACIPFYLSERRISEIDWFGWVNTFQWWYVIPGMCGFAIVWGLPIGFRHLGALRMMVILVSSQIVFSLLWDLYIERSPVNVIRLLGALLAVVGAIISASV